MFELFWISSSSFLSTLSGAVVPGPVFALVLSESLKNGRIAGPLITLGHLLTEGAIILMAFMGLQQVLGLGETKVIVSYVGGVILMLMGLKLLFDAFRVKIERAPDISNIIARGRTPIYRLIFLGSLTSCSNPYFFLWWLATGLPIMINSISIAGVLGFTTFLISHASADLFWFSFVSYSAYKGRRVLNESVLRIVLLACSIFLISFAVYLILMVTAL